MAKKANQKAHEWCDSIYFDNIEQLKTDFWKRKPVGIPANVNLDHYIGTMIDYCESKGEKYVNWCATLSNFIRRDKYPRLLNNAPQPATNNAGEQMVIVHDAFPQIRFAPDDAGPTWYHENTVMINLKANIAKSPMRDLIVGFNYLGLPVFQFMNRLDYPLVNDFENLMGELAEKPNLFHERGIEPKDIPFTWIFKITQCLLDMQIVWLLHEHTTLNYKPELHNLRVVRIFNK